MLCVYLHILLKHYLILPCNEIPVKRYKQYEYDSSIPMPSSTYYSNRKRKIEYDIVNKDEESTIWKQNESISDNDRLASDDQQSLLVDCTSDMEISSIENSELSSSESSDSESTNVETDQKAKSSDGSCNKSLQMAPLYILQSKSGEIHQSDISKYDHALAIAAFSCRHNLSDAATEDLIKLIDLHIPQNNLLEKNAINLKEKVGFDSDFMKCFFFCNVCKSVFENDVNHCQTPDCSGNRLQKKSQSYFSSGNIQSQLCEILSREGILYSIYELHDRKHSSTITDISDGSEYRKLKEEGGFLNNKDNISLTMFTDGIPLFKSSGVSLWPVYLLINEIPRHERFKKKNMVLWGMWQGTGKPNMTIFLKPLITELNDLYINGLSINIGGEIKTCKAILIVVTMDLQARAAVLHMTQHNGKFACVYCLHEGKVVQSGKGHCQCFPFTEEPLILRTESQIRSDGKLAQKDRKPVNGFTGESVLHFLPSFSLKENIVIDYMHGILLGISKKLLTLWFVTKSEKPYFIGNQIQKADDILKSITPPYLIKRLPRKLSNTLHHWKASELRSWLLFYSLPTLLGLLPDLYLKHYSLLVEATYILLCEGISDNDLRRADFLLTTFVKNMDKLYSENVLGLNVHNLLHLCNCVRKWGPLWAWSCFCFESFNGEIKKSVHGTGSVCRQVFWTLQAQKKVENINSLHVSDNVKKFVADIHDKKRDETVLSAVQCLVKKTSVINDAEFPYEIKMNLFTLVDCDHPSLFLKAKTIIRGGSTIYSKLCSKVKKRNSYTVFITPDSSVDGNILEIEYFLVHRSTLHVFAVGLMLKSVGGVLPGNALHVQRVQFSRNTTTVVAVSRFIDLGISFEVNGVKYVSRFPNKIEND